MEIIISGSVANFGGLTNQQFLEYLIERVPDFEFYKFQPTPGRFYAASRDWKAIGNVSAILGILSFIWMAYNELIRSKKESGSNAGIVIQIENAGRNNHFWIGNEINSKEEMIKKSEEILKDFEMDSLQIKAEIEALRNSSHWQRVK
jgi:hypothetical protein